MDANHAAAAKLAYVQRRKQYIEEYMDLDRQEAELTAELRGQPAPYRAAFNHAFAALPTPPQPPRQPMAQPIQPVLLEDAKPHIGDSISRPIVIDKTPPPSSPRTVKREERSDTPTPRDEQRHTNAAEGTLVQSPTELGDGKTITRSSADLQKHPSCGDCQTRGVRCRHCRRGAKKCRHGPVVDDVAYASIIKAVDSDDLVELACSICGANSYLGSCGSQHFFKGAKGLSRHIYASHPSKSEGMNERWAAEQCVHRTLSAVEADAVRNSRHDVFMVTPNIGAENGREAPLKRKRKSAADHDPPPRRSPSLGAGDGALVNSGSQETTGEHSPVQSTQVNHGFAPINGGYGAGQTMAAQPVDTAVKRSSQAPDNGKRARKTAPGGPLAR